MAAVEQMHGAEEVLSKFQDMLQQGGEGNTSNAVWMAVLISLVSVLFGFSGELKTFFWGLVTKFFRSPREKYLVELSKKEYQLGGNNRVYYDDNGKFDAVIDQIKKKAKDLKVDKFVQQKGGRDAPFFPEEGVEIKLEEDIYVKIGREERGVDDDDEGRGKKKKTKDQIFSNTMSVYSPSVKVPQLLEFLTKLEKAYEKAQEDETANERYFISYEDKDGDRLRFQSYQFKTTRGFNNVFFTAKDGLKKQIDFFMNGADWYKKRGIARKLCMLFYGPPGCGKTSTIKAIASYTDRHIIAVPLSKLKTAQDLFDVFFCESFQQTDGCSKFLDFKDRIYLLEDIDAMDEVVLDRKLQAEKKAKEQKEMGAWWSLLASSKKGKSSKFADWSDDKITLSTILNILDGMLELSEQIIIMTTNYPEKLDKALVRPGRVDFHVKFTLCTHQMVVDIFKLFYAKEKGCEERLAKEQFPEMKFSPAEVFQICFQFRDMEDAIDAVYNTRPLDLEKEMAENVESDALARCGSTVSPRSPLSPGARKKWDTEG